MKKNSMIITFDELRKMGVIKEKSKKSNKQIKELIEETLETFNEYFICSAPVKNKNGIYVGMYIEYTEKFEEILGLRKGE